jgi:hypothetical protein
VAIVPSGPNWTPPPTILIKKNVSTSVAAYKNAKMAYSPLHLYLKTISERKDITEESWKSLIASQKECRRPPSKVLPL